MTRLRAPGTDTNLHDTHARSQCDTWWHNGSISLSGVQNMSGPVSDRTEPARNFWKLTYPSLGPLCVSSGQADYFYQFLRGLVGPCINDLRISVEQAERARHVFRPESNNFSYYRFLLSDMFGRRFRP